MSPPLIDALFCSLGLVFWGAATERSTLGYCLALSLALFTLSPYKIHATDKAKSRSVDLTILLAVMASIWYWLQRQSLQVNFALHILSLAPVLLFPKLAFNFLQADGPHSGSAPSRDGANIARRHLSEAFPFSRASLDARRPIRFDSIFFLSCVFISCFYLPWRVSLPLLAFGVIPHAVWNARNRLQRTLVTAGFASCAAAFAILLALLGGKAIEKGQDFAEDYFSQYWSRRSEGMPSGEATDTAIGRRGRIDNGNKLLARLEWTQPSGYLRNGSFSYTTTGITWFAHAPSQSAGDKTIFPGDGSSFSLARAPVSAEEEKASKTINFDQAKISMSFPRERMAIPLPLGANEIFGLPFNKLELNSMGVAVASGSPGYAKFGIAYNSARDKSPPPGEVDLDVPQALQASIDRFIDEAGAKKLPPAEAARAIAKLFSQKWTYTLTLEAPDGSPRSLTRFLSRDRQGHCEYFASATTLAMRRLGIPARYQTGFLVNEYDQREKLFWIRARDAHAWSTYWDGKNWTLLDTTPSAPHEPVDWATAGTDWLSRLQYLIEDFDAMAFANSIDSRLLWALGALGLAYLAVRLKLKKVPTAPSLRSKQADMLSKRLENLTGLSRLPSETSSDFWLRCSHLLREPDELSALARQREQALFMPSPDSAKALADCEASAQKIRRRVRLSHKR